MKLIEIEVPPETVEAHHRFEGVTYRNVGWDLRHLDAFAFRADPGFSFDVDVVVLFSCHCFTHSFRRDGRPNEAIPVDELYTDSRESRVLNPERFELSRRFLPRLVQELHTRTIRVASQGRQNFLTLEVTDLNGCQGQYAVFFEVERDRRRKRRLLLRVQSAYFLEDIKKRQEKAGKVGFAKLLKAAYLGEKIRG